MWAFLHGASSLPGLTGLSVMDEVDWITRELLARRDDIHETEIFVFGSVQRREPPHLDVDLLVTYRTTTELKKVQSILKELGMELPLDVICMYPEEEREVGFVVGQQCTRIFPP